MEFRKVEAAQVRTMEEMRAHEEARWAHNYTGLDVRWMLQRTMEHGALAPTTFALEADRTLSHDELTLALPAHTEQALDAMLQTTFVARVDAPTLAIAVPALARGLRDRMDPEPRRKAATIIKNMCRVVADALGSSSTPKHDDLSGCDAAPMTIE